MIPPDIRLYTWVDVEEVLLTIANQNKWPDSVIWARAYWDGLTLGIKPGSDIQELKNWLSDIYDPRFLIAQEKCSIILESTPDNQRLFPVFFEETEETPLTPKLTPTLARKSIIWQPTSAEIKYPENLAEDLPPVISFHSFKGGVGRTTHALALAQALQQEKYRVLLIDGDLEAPGISWLLEKRFPDPAVSLADLLALVHGDNSPDHNDSIKLVADRLQTMQIDDVYILPAFRSNAKFLSLEIKPEHLIQGSKNPFILTNILAKLGHFLEADAVIIDLRAGLSELATGLILDPRVYRIFVTTLSSQSVAGTHKIQSIIKEKFSWSFDNNGDANNQPLPTFIITQVPENQIGQQQAQEVKERLLENTPELEGDLGDYVITNLEKSSENTPELEGDLGDDEIINLAKNELLVLTTNFADSLMVLPPTWEEVISRLQKSGIVEKLKSLVIWLPNLKSIFNSNQTDISIESLGKQRTKVRDMAKQLVYAETAEVSDFLSTTVLRRLASDHSAKLPNLVIIGAKGSGKTYTFMQIMRRESWHKFTEDVGVKNTSNTPESVIYPLLESKNLGDNAQNIVNNLRSETVKNLEFDLPLKSFEIKDFIETSLTENLSESKWRDRWLDIMAWSVGFEKETPGAGRALSQYLFNVKQSLIFVIDGLEDLFQELANKSQQQALQSLLQDVPEWLRQQPGSPLGIIIFIRRDLVSAAIPQNSAQFVARYEPYILKWNIEEAFRLVAWVVANLAKVLPEINVDKLPDMNENELVESLVPLWGKRLGTEKSKEAYSARFFISAVTDLRGQIQPRDIVRLLYLASDKSINDTKWNDRLLIPKAIKDALPECSREKIKEISEENQALRGLFDRLRNLDKKKRTIPFTDELIKELSPEDLALLDSTGVVIREQDSYYMPEIFRLGLNFTLTQAGRPKVIALLRRVQPSS